MGFSFRYSEWIVFEGISVDEKGKQHYLDATIAYKMAVLNCIHYLSQVSVAMLGCKWHLQLPHFVTTLVWLFQGAGVSSLVVLPLRGKNQWHR